LKAKVPSGLLELLRIPGMGPKSAALVWKQLKVTDLPGLVKALDEGKVQALPGMGAKKAEAIRHGIQFLRQTAGRTPLGVARPLADELLERIKSIKGVKRAEVAGSLRRWKETIGDIDILVQADNGQAVVDQFVKFPQVREVLGAGKTKASVRTDVGVQVDVRVVPAESFGAALAYFTGSKEHNIRMRELAVRRKWKLNEYGLFKGDKQLAGADEESIYAKFDMPWIPPEIREDTGEIEQANHLPKLIELKDIRGDLHMHTTASDGKSSIEQMAEAALAMGYEYIAITDHSGSSRIANGLSAKRMEKHLADIRKAAGKFKDITILAGVELDILSDGSLDYPDSLLSQLDIVIASIHSAMQQDQRTYTGRFLRAMENPHVHVIAHPTGRMLGQREASALDVAALVKQASATGTALELNASWQRLDLGDVHLRQAKQAGVKIAIGTDAHDTGQLQQMRYGVATARRGWLEKSDVLNCLPAKKLLQWLKSGKK